MIHGRIAVTSKPMPFGKYRYEFRLEPDEQGRISIDSDFIHEGLLKAYEINGSTFVQVGGYTLRVIDKGYNPAWGYWVCQQNGYSALWAEWREWGRRKLESLNMRLIATLYVWGMADYHRGETPSWGNVYAVQAVRRWWKG